ncbi:MAG: protein tyrosine phosphatase family protein [Enterobacterales bacterium]|nr:protein tyrosine phosphatase family protein [Enterobacterales bacterium]
MNIKHLLVLFFIVFIQACESNKNTGEFAPYQMVNARAPSPNLVTAGQPSLEDFDRLAKRGVKVVINLRTKKEMKNSNEREQVEKRGMTYISIPIDGSDGITLANVKKLDAAMNNLKQPVLVHCASSNRVGGLLAYRAYILQHKAAQEALSFGRSAGMKSTEKKVKKLLAL